LTAENIEKPSSVRKRNFKVALRLRARRS